MSARSVSACDCTDTYSPAAIDIAPAANPATPAVSTAAGEAPVAATPTIRLAVEMTPSLAPSTAARSQPMRELLCHSAWRCGMRAAPGEGVEWCGRYRVGGEAVAGLRVAGASCSVVFADMPCIA